MREIIQVQIKIKRWRSYTPMISHTDNISETGHTHSIKFPLHRTKNNPLLISGTHRLTVTETGVRVNQFQTTVTSCRISPPSKKSLIQHKQEQLLFFPQAAPPPQSPALALIQKITCSYTLPHKWASSHDITPPAQFLLVWKTLTMSASSFLPEEAGQPPLSR